MKAQPAGQDDLFAAYAPPRKHVQPVPTAEPELFEARLPPGPPVAAPPPPVLLTAGQDDRSWIPPRPPGWRELLTRAPMVPLEVLVLTDWDGRLLEMLSYPGMGQHHLFHGGAFEYAGNRVECALRFVFLGRGQAADLFRRVAFVPSGAIGTKLARFRHAPAGTDPGKAALDWLAKLQDPK